MPKGMLADNEVLRRIVNGPLTGLLERLNGEDGPEWEAALNRFLRRENPWGNRNLLEFVESFTTIDDRVNFNPISCFKVDETEGATVAIRTISPAAQAFFVTMAKSALLRKSRWQEFAVHRLLFASRGTPLTKELIRMKQRRVSLFSIWQLLCQQPHAQEGTLHTNTTSRSEYAENIFLVEDINRTPWFLQLWHPPGRQCWDIDLKPKSYSDRLRRGTSVFTTPI